MTIFLFLFLLTSILSPVHASDPQDAAITSTPTPIPTAVINLDLFEQYKKDYLYQRDKYNEAYLNYTEKKQVHTKYGTLTTKQEKIDATKKVLVARNTMLRTYTMALRVYLDKYRTASETNTQKLQIDLSKWEDWFEEQNLVVDALLNEEDIKRNSEDFSRKWIEIQTTFYTALTQNQVNQKTITLDQIKQLSNDIQTSPDIKPESQEWLSPLAVDTDLINESLKKTITFTQKTQNNKFENFYPSAQKEINKVNTYLSEMVSNLKSVVIKFSVTQ